MKSFLANMLILLSVSAHLIAVAADTLAEESWRSLATAYANACTGFQVKSVSWLETASCADRLSPEALKSEIIEAFAEESGPISWSEYYVDLSYLHVDDSAVCSLYKTQFETSFRIRGLTGISKAGKAVSVNYWNLAEAPSAPPRCMRLILAY